MVRTLELYKDGKKINEQPENENGRTTIRIENLDSNTTYEKGAYKLAWSKNGEVSDLVDVPSFKTKSVAVQEVVVSSESITLNKGDTNNVGASVSPDNAENKSLIYSSNNEDVATVSDSGDVEAIKSGDATITIKSQENEAISAKVRVNVKTPVTNVSVKPKTATLDIGATQQLSANVLPRDADNKKVTYSTGSDAIATVSDTGLVTAVAEGTTDITVTTEEGAKTATSSITVKKAIVNVTGVTLDKTTLSLEEGATDNLVATVAPSTATDKTVTFTSSDAAIATVDNKGKVTAVKAGNADITVTTKDGSKTAKCALTVTEPEPEPEPEVPEEPEEPIEEI